MPDTELWLVADDKAAASLEGAKVSRGAIWTVDEVLDLVRHGGGLQLAAVVRAKLASNSVLELRAYGGVTHLHMGGGHVPTGRVEVFREGEWWELEPAAARAPADGLEW